MYRTIPIIALIVIHFTSCAQEKGYINMNSSKFKAAIDKKQVTLLDVRTPNEYNRGHIAGAGLLNYYNSDFKKKLLLLAKDKPVYLYCNSGNRSARAAKFLVDNGYKEVYNLQRGIMDWYRNSLPITGVKENPQSTVKPLQPEDYKKLINGNNLVFVDFYAPWCAPCRRMMPLIDSLKQEYKDKVEIVKVNTDINKALVKDLQLASIPCFKLYQDGIKVFEHAGVLSRAQIESEFKNNLQD